MENFTPLSAAIGGALIGLSAVMLMAFNGRIAGISGIFSGSAFRSPATKPGGSSSSPDCSRGHCQGNGSIERGGQVA